VAQHRKPAVQEGILGAARRVFARCGYPAATMGAIAREAGLSVGNLYRYHAAKDDLFRAAVPDDVAERLPDLLRRRVASLDGVRDVRDLPPSAPFFAVSEALMSFCVAHRLEVVILLGRAAGTPHEGLAEAVVRELGARSIAHFQALRPGLQPDDADRFVLRRIDRNLVDTLVDALASHEDEALLRQAFAGWSRYHLAGLNAFFGTEGTR
jgi:AcrR family transcriptional regulator